MAGTEKKIKVTLVKSTIGQKPEKVATVRSLGLRKINSSVEHVANPAILGMVDAVAHLVKVEELN
jgi:large subunit ribosomal protein L30